MDDYDALVANATSPPPDAPAAPPPSQAFAPQSAPPPVATTVAAPAAAVPPPPKPVAAAAPTMPDLSSLAEKTAKARAAGYSDDEIKSFLASTKTLGPQLQSAPEQVWKQLGLEVPQAKPAETSSNLNLDALNGVKPEYRDVVKMVAQNRFGRPLNPDSATDMSLLQAALKVNPSLDLSKTGAQGSRESVYLGRQIASGNLGVEALKNIAELPITTTTGWFGSRHTDGGGLFQAGKEALTNSYLVPQVTQEYQSMLGGLSRNLAAIETQGLAPTGALTDSLNSTQFREGDPAIVHLRKLTEIRQIIEKGLEPILSNPRVPTEQKQGVASIIQQAQTAIPYTHHDLTEFERNAKPYQSIADYAASKGIGKSAGQSSAQSGAPAAAPSLPQGFPPNARQAPDGNFYVPNPNGTGYLRVRPGG